MIGVCCASSGSIVIEIEMLSPIFNVALSGFNVILETCGSFVHEAKSNKDKTPIRGSVVVRCILILLVNTSVGTNIGKIPNTWCSTRSV